MQAVIVGFLLLVFATLFSAWVQINKDEDAPSPDPGLNPVARQISSTRSVRDAARSRVLSGLRDKVSASGAFGGNFEAYLSAQMASLLIGGALFLIVALSPLEGIWRIALLLVGFGVSLLPYNSATKNAGTKAAKTAAELPVFAQMLQIPLASGMSVEQSLRFTTRFHQGIVSTEVNWLVDILQSGTMNDADAFVEAGRRLGTSEAAAFFSTLGQAHIEGTKVSETLNKQAESLRNQYHQVRRAKVKKMPVTLIVAFALHFMPLLFALVMVPMMLGLKGLG